MSPDGNRSDALTARMAHLTPERQQLVRRLLEAEGVESGRLPILEQRRGDEPVPLSFAQERLWFLEQLTPGTAAFHVHTGLPIDSAVDVGVLERSLQEITRRHDILRSRIVVIDGSPTQVVSPDFRLSLPVDDLSTLDRDARRTAIVRLATEEATARFDLLSGPLIRTRLLRLGVVEWMLLVTTHHIVCDGWSMEVLNRELQELYSSGVSGRVAALAPLPIQYADFALWQRRWMQGPALEQQLDFWRKALAGAPRTLDLPADRPRLARSSLAGSRVRRPIPPAQADRLRALSQQEGVTLFMTLLSAFALLLHRYTGRDDIVVGSPIANRTRPEVAPLIGFFVNTLVLRIDLSGNPTCRELLRRVRDVALGAYDHQDVPFEALVQELRPERDLRRTPLFQVTFQLFTSPGAAGGDAPAIVDVDRGTANVDLAFDVEDGPFGLSMNVEYSTELFDRARVDRLLDHFDRITLQILADPARTMDSVGVLTEDEVAACEAWNDTASEVPGPVLLHDLVLARAAVQPTSMAIVGQGAGLTYDELAHRAGLISRRLVQQNLGPERLVGVLAQRTEDFVASVLGVLMAGGAYVPMHPAWPEARQAWMMEDCGVQIVIASGGLRSNVSRLAGIVMLTIDDLLDERRNTDLATQLSHDISSSSLAYVIYTSGSSGRPRGVMVEHRSVSHHIRWMMRNLPLTRDDRVLQHYSPSFDASIAEIFSTLASGATLVAAKPEDRVDVAGLARLIQAERVTVVDVVPSLLDALLREPAFTAASSLRRVLCGGEAISPTLVDRCRAQLSTELVNFYGPTEATIAATWWPVLPGPDLTQVPIGRPIANTTIHLLDSSRNRVPVGIPGEIYIGGIGVARGYLHADDLTTQRFVPDGFNSDPTSRLFRTGDRGRHRPDGAVEFLGRVDDQIKLRGFRIEPGEIETVLRRHPGVEAAVVTSTEVGVAGSAARDSSSVQALEAALDDLPAVVAEELIDSSMNGRRTETMDGRGPKSGADETAGLRS